MHPARGGATGAQAPAQGTGRGHLATQEPREPEPGLWASLCGRSHDAAHVSRPRQASTAPSPAGPCPAPARGGRDGDGTGAFGAGQPDNTGGANSARSANMPANRQAGFRPERSEAGTEAGGRRRIPARVGPTEQQYRRGRAAPAPRHPLPDRVRHRARGGQSTGRTFTGGANSARSAIPAATPDMPLSGRSAQRRPADGC